MSQPLDPTHLPPPPEALQFYEAMRAGRCPVRLDEGSVFVLDHAQAGSILREAATYQQMSRPVTDDEKVLSELNGPLHAAVRRVFMKLITPKRMQAYDELVRQEFAAAIDTLLPSGRCDIVNDIARPVTSRIIGLLSNLDDDLQARVPTYAETYTRVHTGQVELRVQTDEFDRLVTELVAERRAQGIQQDDWLSVLLECTDETGQPLSDARLTTMFTKDLLVGGSETTSRVMGLMFHYLLSTPGAWTAVCADRSLVPAAVEEALRMAPALRLLRRVPNQDVTVGDEPISSGCPVIASVEAANYDASAFDDPLAFRLDRGAIGRRHLTFGGGAHLCVGAPLARLELAICLDEFAARFPHLHLDDGFELEYQLLATLNGIKEMPVNF